MPIKNKKETDIKKVIQETIEDLVKPPKIKKIPELCEKVLWIKNQALIFHWQETSGFRHEILGKYYKEISEHIDDFVESYIGTFGEGSIFISNSLYKVVNFGELTIEEYLLQVEKILLVFRECIDGITGLTNIIDNTLSIVGRNKYLLRKT
jgi:hypothetical protein